MNELEVLKGQVPLDDFVSMVFFAISWFLYSVFSELEAKKKKVGVLAVMTEHRLNWMKAMLRRENRLADINAVGNLMRSIAFFASTSVLIVVGVVGVIGKQDALRQMAESVPFSKESTNFVWELKLVLLMVLFIYAFFKFTWSLRQYNYLNVVIAGAPLASTDKSVLDNYARWAAKVSSNAARHFGYGLRAYYYAMAVLAWFISPFIFILTTAWVVWILYRREFRSHTLENLMRAIKE